MTILGPETIKAIEDHRKAQRLAERGQRLADLARRQQKYQARQMANQGYGRENIKVQLKNEHGLGEDEANEIAKEAVFGRGK